MYNYDSIINCRNPRKCRYLQNTSCSDYHCVVRRLGVSLKLPTVHTSYFSVNPKGHGTTPHQNCLKIFQNTYNQKEWQDCAQITHKIELRYPQFITKRIETKQKRLKNPAICHKMRQVCWFVDQKSCRLFKALKMVTRQATQYLSTKK